MPLASARRPEPAAAQNGSKAVPEKAESDSHGATNMIQASCWGRPAWMAKPYSEDLRRRAVEAVEGGATIPEAAEQCGVSISSVVRFLKAASENRKRRGCPIWGL